MRLRIFAGSVSLTLLPSSVSLRETISAAAIASLSRKAAPLTASPVTSVCLDPEVVPESGAFSVLLIPIRMRDFGSPVASAASWEKTV